MAVNGRRRSSEDKGLREREKDADVVVVDASVLVHALYQVKKWCRDGREEVIIIPLEGKRSFSNDINRFLILLLA